MLPNFCPLLWPPQFAMDCPLCGDECRCTVSPVRVGSRVRASFSPHERELIDPDAFDSSEEQFFASVAHSEIQIPETDLTAETDDGGFRPDANDQPSASAVVEGRQLSARDEAVARLRGSGIEREFAAREILERNLRQMSEMWRDEVAKRVEGYRTRRSKKRLSGEFSMNLDFERPPRMTASSAAYDYEPEPLVAEDESAEMTMTGLTAPEVDVDQFASAVADTPHTSEAEPSPATADEWMPMPPLPGEHHAPSKPPASAKAPIRESKIIEFPRSLLFPEEDQPYSCDELAESMQDKPRILDVPDTVSVPASPLADVALEREPDFEPAPQPDFDLPLQVAPLPQRFTAALLDWLIVAAATGVFGFIVAYWTPALPHTKPLIGLALALPVVFWAIYHYLFLVHAAMTPGMQMSHLRMSAFDSHSVPRRIRRYRALVMVLSCVSLGFGFLWSVFDEDNLCWHDRMTRTYTTMER